MKKHIKIKSYNLLSNKEEDCIINIDNYVFAIFDSDIDCLRIYFKNCDNCIFSKMNAKKFYNLVNENE